MYEIYGLSSDLENLAHPSEYEIIWKTFLESLLHIGLSEDCRILTFIVDTIVSSHKLFKAHPEIDSVTDELFDMDFVSLLQLQIATLNPKVGKPLKSLVSSTSDDSIIVAIWRAIIPWHQAVTHAWRDGAKLAPAAHLDVQCLANLSLSQRGGDLNNHHRQLLAMTVSIAGQLLLTIGKRTEGRRLLFELTELFFEWGEEEGFTAEQASDFGASVGLLSDLMLEIGVSSWLDKCDKYCDYADMAIYVEEYMKSDAEVLSQTNLEKIKLAQVAFF